MLYELNDATVTLGGKEILSHISLQIKERDRIALIGENGAGKTTLLRLIMGEVLPDADDKRNGAAIRTSRKITKGILRQIVQSESEQTVREYIDSLCGDFEEFSKERYEFEIEFDRLFTGFGFSAGDKEKPLKAFSGGELTKISFIHLLLEQPDLLLLDEPTNHLDIETVEWLEKYMQKYPKAVVYVSHDRFFLDRVCNSVLELESSKLIRYAGNYSEYRKQKRKNYQIQKKAYDAQQQEMERLNALIEKFKHKPSKAGFAKAKKSQLMRMKAVEKPASNAGHMFVEPIEPEIPGGKLVYEAENLKIGYDCDKMIAELSFRLRRGQKVAIIGKNGSGKSTFLKTAAGLLEPLKGKSTLGNHVLMGYFDQHSADRLSEETVYDMFRREFPMPDEKQLRSILAAYLFVKSDVYKRVCDLSGGERARLYLAMLLQRKPNLLVLDEPTNHMDIRAKETLESAFSVYKGSMLFVSHDRYLVDRVADAILLFEDGKVYYYPFGYKHYLEHVIYADEESPSARILAEDQARIDALRAVPKPERHRLREQNTELAYVDWKRSLAAEPIDMAWNELDRALLENDELMISAAEESLTDACMNWYNIYLETE